MAVSSDFKDLLRLFNDFQVKYLVVGGYAVIKYTEPRYTKDLDVWVLIGSDNAERLISAIADFGMEAVGLQPADFMEPDTVIQLGYPPVRIDLLTSASGVDFEDCWARRVAISVGSVAAGFISYEDLIANKRASGRAQDAVDVDVLEGRNTQGH